ncbi:peptidoglycan-binding protein [Streptomyces bikiniensis]|uniref:peptidoglycan-binding protein n=1 Tax=Streptomyces bikiniensis TaxID=1896 RepID=UPI0004BFF999|nr:peptidoglycan-binding protein [Streptomyces bikiniensis]
MSRWKELPADLESSERRLLAWLRRLKDHSGLSLAALAARTSYSRSSWERYLNGKKPVPRRAVEELARECGTEPTRLVVLYEVVERARARTPAPVEPQPAPPEAEEKTGAAGDGQAGAERASAPARAVPLPRALLAVALAAVVAFGAGLLTAGVWDGGDAEAAKGVVAGSGYLRGQTYACETRREDGALRAGHSDTREMLLDINSTGFDVVEAQCLLHAKGFGPGAFDGLYDERTKGAVKDFQRSRRLVADGIVGPDTWGELRR